MSSTRISPLIAPRPSPRADSRAPASHPGMRWSLWGQWIAANMVAEALGLGGTLLIGVALFTHAAPLLGAVAVALLGVILGACLEGGVVGTAQWLVLRQALPELSWRSWAVATAIGAGVAWAAGMLPSTLADLLAPASGAGGGPGATVQDLSGWALYGAAAALGLVAGAILAVAQWWVLRRYVPRASVWLPANACAWAVGMALIFAGVGFIPASGVTPVSAALLIACVIAAGAAVGAIHGLALIWLLRARDLRALGIS